jgi:hypothetical protein
MIENAFVNNFINQRLRPATEKARSLYAKGLDLVSALDNILPILIEAEAISIEDGEVTVLLPDMVIQDNRTNEGIPPITVGQMFALIESLSPFVSLIEDSDDLKSLINYISVSSLDVI